MSDKRPYPLQLQKLQTLLKRLPEHHEKKPIIKEELSKALAGFYGEDSLDYYFQFIDQQRYLILKDLRLPNENSYFYQLDTLFLSSNFFLILEIKNISGTLMFDTSLNQMTRTLNGVEEGFRDPILQVQRQKIQLYALIERLKLPQIPIHSLVVISNPSTIIKSTSRDIKKSVIHAASLPDYIRKLEATYTTEIFSMKQLKSLKQKLIKLNQPYDAEVLTRYDIRAENLIKGVECPSCNCIPMQRKKGFWYCEQCKVKSTNAHESALHDYALLISNMISNRELRDFLGIRSEATALRLLQSMKLDYIGDLKYRKYRI